MPPARLAGAAAVLAVIASCAPGVATQPGATPGQGSEPGVPSGPAQPTAADLASCQGAPYLRLVGQDATALERELILRQVRLIRPDTAVTMDYREDRLNFYIDAGNRIERVTCG